MKHNLTFLNNLNCTPHLHTSLPTAYLLFSRNTSPDAMSERVVPSFEHVWESWRKDLLYSTFPSAKIFFLVLYSIFAPCYFFLYFVAFKQMKKKVNENTVITNKSITKHTWIINVHHQALSDQSPQVTTTTEK